MKRTLIFLSIIGIALVSACNKNSSKEEPQRCLFSGNDCAPPDFSVIDSEPAWSPDGKYIAYLHGDKDPGKTGIYLIKPDGTGNHLWHAGLGAMQPAWSPDGEWIAFSEGAQIRKKKLNGDSMVQITTEGLNWFPSWSPDGEWIVYSQSICNSSKNCGLWITSLKTQQANFLVNYAGFPNWNLITNEILYSTRIVEPNGTVLGDSLWLYSLSLNLKKPLTALKGANYSNNYFKYSINNTIAFTSQSQGGVPQIWTMNADGTNIKQLTTGYTCDWSPDANKLVYTNSKGGNGRLWIMNADGSNKQQLTFETNF